jgi:hypothetical protein
MVTLAWWATGAEPREKFNGPVFLEEDAPANETSQ